MSGRDGGGRAIEGGLAMAALALVLAPLWCLVYFGKTRTPPPPNAIPINRATSLQFQQALGIEPETAAALVAWRERVHGFDSVDALLDAPLFTEEQIVRLTAAARYGRLEIRATTPRMMAATLGISLPSARRLAAYRDGLLPSPFEPPGRRVGAKDPLADASVVLRHAPLLDPHAARPLLNRFSVRTPTEVALHFVSGVTALGLAMLILPALLRAGRRGGDPFLLPLALLLSGIGVAILFSAKDPYRDRAVYEHHLIGLIVSLVLFSVCARLAPAARARIKSYLYLWVIGAFLLVAALFVFGSGPEGVKLNLFHFQPVELIKLFLTFFLAAYLADRADLIADTSARRLSGGAYTKPGRRQGGWLPRRQDLGPVLVMFAVALLLFVVIKDMGPALLLFGTFVALLCITTGRGSFLITGGVLLLAGGLLGYAGHLGVFGTRVDMWLHPFANAHPNGMQLGQSYWGLASGGWEGSGPGLGMTGLIPRSGSDLAFASWGEETGIAGSALALLIFVVLVWRGVGIALRAATDFDRALALGLTILLGLQAFLILGGVTGLLPLSGISLPFMSYGNSALAAAFVTIGLLRGISMQAAGIEGTTPRPAVVRGARQFAFGYAVALLIGIGGFRLIALQGLRSEALACRPIMTPDADGVRRAHWNPRLLAIAREIPRGSIYDSHGAVVATSRLAEMVASGQSTQTASRLTESHGRWYPFGAALAHIVGWVDPTVGGPLGLEKSYNSELRGYDRVEDLLKDYRRRNVPGYRPRVGHDLILTIDAKLQRDVQRLLDSQTAALTDKATGRRKDRAALVLMRPETGDVLAAATLPSFDPNGLTPARLRQMAVGEEAERERPLINRATNGWYPPGSTMKIATTAAALETLPNAEEIAFACNRVSPTLHWRAHGESYARANIHDDQGDPDFGRLALPRAFEVSSNIYFANLAVRLDPEAFRGLLVDKLEFSHVPDQSAFDADLADIGYGQGRMLASPMEMCRMTLAVAAGGMTAKPRFVARIDTHFDDPKPQTDRSRRPRYVELPVRRERAMRAETAERLQRYMRGVVTSGTARGVFDNLAFPVAGKTGTAQNHQYDRQPHSWFVGFAPAEPAAPARFAFACVVENGGYGKTVSAVICRDVLKRATRPGD